MFQMKHFINRVKELALLKRAESSRGLWVFYGRRRVGKTHLIKHHFEKHAGRYAQAIEGHVSLQIEQVLNDWNLQVPVLPRTWIEFFKVIDELADPDILGDILCIDEFPYLVETTPELPSLFQRWWDHRKNKKCLFIIAGSSRGMMHSLFLEESSPMFGRAEAVTLIEPMDYAAFCQFHHLAVGEVDHFLSYSLVGGMPKYWQWLDPDSSALENAHELFFSEYARMEHEPRRVLSDEKIEGIQPMMLLESIGRGAHRVSEIAGRIGVPQTSLGRGLRLLLDSSLIQREMPYGETLKTSKRTLYKIIDPMLYFWFGTYSALRVRWHQMDQSARRQAIYLHASKVFENEVRQQFRFSSRYWNEKGEIDWISPDLALGAKPKDILVGEVKFTTLKKSQKAGLELELTKKIETLGLNAKCNTTSIQVWDWPAFVAHLSQRR